MDHLNICSSCIVLYCIVLYCIVLYCIVLYIVLYCIALYCIALYCLHCIVCIVLHCIVSYCIALHCIALHCIVLYCIVFYCMTQATCAVRCLTSVRLCFTFPCLSFLWIACVCVCVTTHHGRKIHPWVLFCPQFLVDWHGGKCTTSLKKSQKQVSPEHPPPTHTHTHTHSLTHTTPPPPRPPRWPSSRASASRAEGPGFESRLRRDFFRGRVIPVT